MSRFVRAAILALALSVLLLPAAASAHRDACHTWHACQPDDGSLGYTCGDMGYADYCDNPPNTLAEPALSPIRSMSCMLLGLRVLGPGP